MNITRLIDLHELAKRDCEQYSRKRFLSQQISQTESGKHFTGIVGPRGVGKTVLLRQYAVDHADAFYLSADTLEPGDDLWDVTQTLKEHYAFRTLLIDEIHFLPKATEILKRLYDFIDIRVIFSSSVALAMRASAHDLSRRVRLLELHTFSFREYVAFKSGTLLPPLTLQDLIDGNWTAEHLREGHRFDKYLTKGELLPFSLDEPDPLPLLHNIIEKIITRDIPSVARLTTDELAIIRNLLRFIGRSGVDGINYSSLSRNIGITKYKAEQYVDCLEKAFILHRILPKGTNVLREPKILMAPPCRLLYRDLDDAIGGLREDFFAEAMVQAGIEFSYLKSTRGKKTPDFLITNRAEKLVIEIGGRGKGREQFKGITIDRKLIFSHIDTPAIGRIPLFLLGYLA